MPNDGYNKRLAVNTEPNRNARVCNSDFRRVCILALIDQRHKGKKGAETDEISGRPLSAELYRCMRVCVCVNYR